MDKMIGLVGPRYYLHWQGAIGCGQWELIINRMEDKRGCKRGAIAVDGRLGSH